ncbi:MAG: hypothetical protein SGI87_06945 [Flavobacteriales bacterium]|nr:hypothetical protein [Flavobacteriales bacterium]
MKNAITILTVSLCFWSHVHAQESANSKGTWSASIGWEGGIYYNDVETNLYGADSSYTDTAGAVFVPVHLEYYINNRLSAGIKMKFGRYIEDNANEENSARVFDITIAYHLLQKPKGDLYIQMALGGSNLQMERNAFPSFDGEWGGGHFGLGAGYRQYFGDHVGLYTSFGYNSYGLNQKSLNTEGIEIDPKDASWDMKLRGYEFSLGLIVKW